MDDERVGSEREWMELMEGRRCWMADGGWMAGGPGAKQS